MSVPSSHTPNILAYFKGWKIAIPLFISMSIAIFMLSKVDFGDISIKEIDWTSGRFISFITASLFMMILRDLGYIARIRALSFKAISWKNSFQIIMLWELVSAISPTAVGGTAAAVVIVGQEKIDNGKTTAMVLLTSFLDELFYITMVPLVFLIAGTDILFPEIESLFISQSGLITFFWIGYSFLFLWTLLLGIAILYKPQVSGFIILKIFSLPFLRRWKSKAEKLSSDFVTASNEFRGQPPLFWLKVYGYTFLAWTARFIMVNFLILAFGEVSGHFTIYARQLVMWILLLVVISPGASGFAEKLFPWFLGGFFASKYLANIAAILWRLISYVLYIVAGMVVLPFWLKRISKK